MNMRIIALAAALLTAAFALPAASAAEPLPPLVGVCVDEVTAQDCFRGNWVCVGFSYQVPQCVPHQTVTCGSICDLEPATGDAPPQLVSVCVDGVRGGCYGAAFACVTISQMVPQCVACPLCNSIPNPPEPGQPPSIPDPCETPYLDCVCQICHVESTVAVSRPEVVSTLYVDGYGML